MSDLFDYDNKLSNLVDHDNKNCKSCIEYEDRLIKQLNELKTENKTLKEFADKLDEEFGKNVEPTLSEKADNIIALYRTNKKYCEIADEKINELQSQLDQANEKLKGAIELPVKLGDTIYVVPSRTNYQINIINNKEEKNKVSEFVVSEIRYNKYGYSIVCYIDYIPFYFNYETAKGYCEHFNTEKFYGETWFTTREEAEKKLQELRGGE